MNEGLKTGVFWIISVLMLAIGLFMAWPQKIDNGNEDFAGRDLFENFKDPLAASSLKIVTFDEEQGKVESFEVRRDAESGQWTIPSRKGYPADAVEQMKDAANALVGLTVLDVQTRVAEDHEALGVVEPKLEDLEVGDEGVGRLVTFKDQSQNALASVIIGNPVKDEEGKIYVRKPGQDPVYVVELDESALSTRFRDWIEDDLLKLSSIDIAEMTIKDYSASMSGRGISLQRQYTTNVGMNGPDWVMNELLEYQADNPLADPKKVEMAEGQELNKEKLDGIKDALDDLKIVDVARKPDGMSSNLRADKDLVSDNEALQSLATRGFFPVSMGAQEQFEVLSANGELNVTINDGVQYVLRFGNVSGLSSEEDQDDSEDGESSGGVNRYLLVTTRVDEDQFPAPELKPVPQTIEELAAMLGEEMEKPAPEEPKSEEPPAEMKAAEESPEEKATEPKVAEEKPAAEKPAAEKPMKEEPKEAASEKSETAKEKEPEGATKKSEPEAKPKNEAEKTAEPKGDDAKPEATKDVEVSGEGEATGTGQGADDEDEASLSDAGTGEPVAADQSDEPEASEDDDDEVSFAELSEDEKMERLEAEQEKILKENTRLLDQRKEKLNEAKRKVRDLNARFADWYYVIPEDTYSKLRISRDELFVAEEAEEEDAAAAAE